MNNHNNEFVESFIHFLLSCQTNYFVSKVYNYSLWFYCFMPKKRVSGIQMILLSQSKIIDLLIN